MSRAVNAIVIGVAVFVLLAGSIWYVMVIREPNRIRAETEREWGPDGDEFIARVTFRNPYDYEVILMRYDYEFRVNGDEWGGGGDAPERTLPPRTEYTAVIRQNISVEGISGWLRTHVTEAEETVVRFQGEALFSLSQRNATIPFGYEERFSTRILQTIEDAHTCDNARTVCYAGAEATWGRRDEAIVLRVDAHLRNPTDARADLGNSTFRIRWGGVDVATGRTGGGYIDPGDTQDIGFLVYFEHDRLVEWWKPHTRACERSEASAMLVMEIAYEDPRQPEESESASPSPSPSNTTQPTNTTSGPNGTSSAPGQPEGPRETQNAYATAFTPQTVLIRLPSIRTAFVCQPG